LKKSDGLLDFSQPAEILEKKIRGLWPWPGASAIYLPQETQKSCRVTIALAQVVKTVPPKGATVGTLDENLCVICGRDALKILKIQPAGKPLMHFADFVNGRRTKPGDIFAKIEAGR
jgi:methionyl-tRNA formyltransferase